MKCPFCQHQETKVIDSRINQTHDITRRRRSCLNCEGRFTTYERVEEVMPVVIKKDGRREPFSRDKLMGGIQAACQKTKVTAPQIENIIKRTERRIQSVGLKEIPAKTIGQMVMIELHALNKVAYVRFSSVYREFKDVDEFVAELKLDPAPVEDKASLSFSFLESNLNSGESSGDNKQEQAPT